MVHSLAEEIADRPAYRGREEPEEVVVEGGDGLRTPRRIF